MSEAELLELAALSRQSLSFVITQLVAIQFALYIALYAALGRFPFSIRFMALVVYSVGYLALFGLFEQEIRFIRGTTADLSALESVGETAKALIGWSAMFGKIQVLATYFVVAAGWLTVAVPLLLPIFKRKQSLL